MQRNCLRRVIGTLCFLLLILAAHAQKYTVTGGRGTPYLAFDNKKGNTSSRFEVYLVYGMDNVEIRYTPTSSTYQWYRYKNKAGVGGDAEKIPSVNEGNTTVIRNIEEGYGYYILEDDAYSKAGGYVWIIDYSKYAFDVTSLYVDAQKSNCDNMFLGGDIDMKEMRYYDQSGVPGILKREFDITYQTMKNPEDGTAFIPETVTDTVDDPFNGFELKAPLCDTDVTLTGDLFARHFGVEKTMTTDVYQAIAVEAVMKIDTLSYASDVPNLVVKGDSLSAPVEFNFTAIANTPVAAMFNWKIYRKDEGGGSSEGNEEGEENNGTLLRDFSGEETSFIFNQNGTYVVKLTVNDRTGQCQANPPDVTVNISDSYLDVPNAFSPGTSPGINDEFRVAYRSLTRFKCWIFNRWGVEMYHWTDPSKGWDGKKGGKYVAPGVYFYVIEATGSDGKPIKRKGSINILRSKQIQDEIIEE
ncbi:gliding motility-associated C-terminal domain-containing protein [Parabacteroides goldsteinii]|jgi:gliding motility-associated-like protein|uniref:T9SS type B sorting domain-containing protein n=1 Tax=Parabacteroides goldsteinii TaxID=328812 RepID=UPI00101BAE9F|nr:gliding motility-associated C-terminal domain-containing protein [Parabacteroides goldsteinii]MBS6576219.1 gliding motility-associated C-terminal domain-containing protein [Parabacteroides goldsteinii]